MKKKKIKSKLLTLVTSTLLLFSLSSTSVLAADNNSITLTAQSNDAENFISLNWTPSDTSQNYSYRVYAKGDGEKEFHSLPAKSSNIEVLNIYPSTKDNKGNDKREGDNVKDWINGVIDSTNNTIIKEGYGKGLINVTSKRLQEFNADPYGTLQNENGQWKYDVIFFGAWDNNNNQDLTENTLKPIREFSNAGYGILFGHDTLRGELRNFKSLSDLVNIKVEGSTPICGDLDTYNRSRKTKIQIEKTGLLTNYPYELKGQLDVPVCHTFGQVANGDIWIRFLNHPGISYDHSRNFYLTTYNNCAMIQTGHSNGNATDDEQKILANTLFYLAQVTNGQNSDSHKTQDLTAPDKPQIISLTKNFINHNNSITFESAKDNGTTYDFYVEGYPIENGIANRNKAIRSNSISKTITTGIKGYVTVIDKVNNTTITDARNVNTSNTFTWNPIYTEDYYIHVAAVDNAGNISETSTIKIPSSFESSIELS